MFSSLQLGLRTLVIASRELSDSEFNEFDELLTNARNALNDRDELVCCFMLYSDLTPILPVVCRCLTPFH